MYVCTCVASGLFVIHVFIIQKELTLYVDKNGTVEDLLCEAEKEVHIIMYR